MLAGLLRVNPHLQYKVFVTNAQQEKQKSCFAIKIKFPFVMAVTKKQVL